MHRQADGARLVHDRPLDVLADPPGGVGGETETALRVELFEGVDEAEVALLDQVEQRDPAVQVVLGDVHNQAQVALDQGLAGGEIARAQAPRKRQLFFGRQERVGADLVEIQLGDIAEKFGIGRLRGRLEENLHLRRQILLGAIQFFRHSRIVHAALFRLALAPTGGSRRPCWWRQPRP